MGLEGSAGLHFRFGLECGRVEAVVPQLGEILGAEEIVELFPVMDPRSAVHSSEVGPGDDGDDGHRPQQGSRLFGPELSRPEVAENNDDERQGRQGSLDEDLGRYVHP